ncbi:MAG: hypothetical protein A3E80_04665 [Chlamydiae bacterium RIFCSPHIGHO2_12_FULL_49_9]|nr:MAG: hypothetical protein A3E80_04665 [Chlamydiae bacterium RIFCSPHIGHO2_12_FULL_49_9]
MRAFLFFFVCPAICFCATHRDIPQLTLSASAQIAKPADELQMKIGVVTMGKSAEEALEENSRKMDAVMRSLQFAGLASDDYETSHFSIQPQYTPCPHNPPPNWRASIVGYEVTNSILIHTAQLGLAGKLIDLANKAGANSIGDIRFGLKNSRDYWTEALMAAGANGVRDAQAIASATGVRLVRVLSISLNHTHVKSHQINYASMARGAEVTTPIEPGDVQIEASVNLVYEIE